MAAEDEAIVILKDEEAVTAEAKQRDGSREGSRSTPGEAFGGLGVERIRRINDPPANVVRSHSSADASTQP